MAYAMFYGDYRYGEDPLVFLTYLETYLAKLPHLSESEKCERFYNHCKSDSDAEDWYEDLERNSPTVVASWSTLRLHFRVKWLKASPDSLLDTLQVASAKLDTATSTTSTTAIANAKTTTIPAPANTAAQAIYETTATPEQLDQALDVRHVTPVPARSAVELTTTTTAADLNSAITEIEQQDEEEPGVRRVEDGKGVEKEDGASKRETERREVDTRERGGTGITQGEVRDPAPSPTDGTAVDPEPDEPERFDWATDIDESPGPVPTFVNAKPDHTPAPVDPVYSPHAPVALASAVPANPVPGDVPIDPVRTRSANAAPSNPTASAPANPDPTPPKCITTPIVVDETRTTASQLDRALPKRTVTPQNGDVAPAVTLASTAPTAPTPVNPVPSDVMIDPVRIAFANPVPCSTTIIPPMQPVSSPSNDPATPAKPAIASITSETAAHASDMRTTASLAKPDTDRRTNGSGKAPLPLASLQPAPSSIGGPITPPQPDCTPPKPAVTSFGGDVALRAPTPTAGVPIASRAPTSTTSYDPTVPVEPAPVSPKHELVPGVFIDPSSNAPVGFSGIKPTATAPANPVHTALVNTALVNHIPVDPVPVSHVHVDPVCRTHSLGHPSCICMEILVGHGLCFFCFGGVRVLDRERGRSLFVGGALVIVSYAHSTGARGPVRGFGVLLVSFSSHCP
jgi:hypothetical protein